MHPDLVAEIARGRNQDRLRHAQHRQFVRSARVAFERDGLRSPARLPAFLRFRRRVAPLQPSMAAVRVPAPSATSNCSVVPPRAA